MRRSTSNLSEPLPTVLNQVLVEPAFGMREREQRFTFSTSLIGITPTYSDNPYAIAGEGRRTTGVSAGDFDFTAGRKMVRWGTGYAFTRGGSARSAAHADRSHGPAERE